MVEDIDIALRLLEIVALLLPLSLILIRLIVRWEVMDELSIKYQKRVKRILFLAIFCFLGAGVILLIKVYLLSDLWWISAGAFLLYLGLLALGVTILIPVSAVLGPRSQNIEEDSHSEERVEGETATET